MKTRICIAATLVTSTLSVGAWGQEQPWLRDRRYGEGIGIRAGNLELHPGAGVEAGYDSNYFQRAGEPEESVVAAMRLRPTAHLSLSTLSPQRRVMDQGAEPPKVNFRGGLSLSGELLVPLDSEDSEALRRHNDVGIGADLLLDILPSKPWGGDINAQFVRTVQPSNDPELDAAFDRDALRAGAGVIWRPGGGLFDWRLGYEFRLNYYEDDNLRQLSNQQHYANTRGRWRFLPRTALMYDAEVGAVHYTSENQRTLHDSNPVRARLGLNGLMTSHLGLLALVGWGASFYRGDADEVDDYDSLIANAEVKWYILPQPRLPEDRATVGLSSIAAGYLRDFSNGTVTDYYQRDRGYLEFSYFFAGRVLLALTGGLSHISYPAAYFADGTVREPPGTGGFTENRVDTMLFAEYRFTDQFGLNATLRYDTNLTDARMAMDPEDEDVVDYREFDRFQGFLGVRWFM